MKTNTPPHFSQGLTLLKRLFDQGHRIFSRETALNVARDLHIAEKDLNVILHRLAKQEKIKRLRRGLYVAIGILGETRELHPFVISSFLVTGSVISHQSALEYHGLTEQISVEITASSTQRILVNPIVLDHLAYRYTMMQPQHYFGHDKIWMDPIFRISITDKERTLIDLFANPQRFGGFGEALGVLQGSLGDIDVTRLVKYAVQYDEKTLIKRLGWALEQFDISESILKPLLKVPVTYYCPLDPEKVPSGTCDKRWSIQNNLKSKYKK